MEEALSNKRKATTLWLETLEPVLQPQGFQLVRSQATFRRKGAAVQAKTVVDIGDYWPVRFDIRMDLSLWPAWPPGWDETARAAGAEVCLVDASRLARQCGVEPPGDPAARAGNASIRSVADLQALAGRWSRLFEAGFVPLCRRCDDLAGLEREFNAEDSVFTPMPIGLLLAAVAGRADLAALSQRYRQTLPHWFHDKLDRLTSQLRARGLSA